jgi:predicted lipid-binding transport protein (Tim44 family)
VTTEPEPSPEPRIAPRESSRGSNLMAGLIVTAPVGSLVVGVATGAIFILGIDGVRAVVAGLIVGGLIWLVIGVAATSFLQVDRANRSIHKELTTRMETMSAGPMPASAESQLYVLAQELGVSPSSTPSDEERRRLITQLQNPSR